MIIILCIYSVLITALAIYYYCKAKEFESLFELSKRYEPIELQAKDMAFKSAMQMVEYLGKELIKSQPKLNKDGSIAKKRGRKPKA